jgi:hypothetical protein
VKHIVDITLTTWVVEVQLGPFANQYRKKVGVQFYTASDRVRRKLAPMISEINIIHVEEDGPDGIAVMFSDGTFGAYVVEELLELRPHRETVQVESRPSARGKTQLSRRKPESAGVASLRRQGRR